MLREIAEVVLSDFGVADRMESTTSSDVCCAVSETTARDSELEFVILVKRFGRY